MAARFWQRIVAGEMAFAALVTLLLSSLLPLPRPAAVASAIAILAALQWLPAAAAGLLSPLLARSPQSLDGSTPSRSHSAWAVARSILTEGAALARASLAMSVAPPGRAPRAEAPSGDRRPRPVLLIHGVLCNGAVWRALVRRFARAGYSPVRTLDLEPLGADIDYHATRVVRELSAMRRECGGERVAMVAHSMGGLVARAALRLIEMESVPGMGPAIGSPAVSRVVTLGTPHHGTAWAALLHSKPMQQMSPDSSWLHTLNASPHALTEPAARIPITSIYSLDDALVVPARSAKLENACNIELRGLGHLGLLTSREASEAVLHALAGEGLERARSSR